MKQFFSLFISLFISTLVSGQNYDFISDSVMAEYMKSGAADSLFVPHGKYDNEGQKQGKWQYFEVDYNFVCLQRDVELFGPNGPENIEPGRFTAYFLIYSEGKFKNDKRKGKWLHYLVVDSTFDVIPFYEARYKDGIKMGKAEYFFPNGNTALVGEFFADHLQGPATMYYKSGDNFGDLNFDAGRAHGEQIHYYRDGQIKHEINYDEGKAEGRFITYYPEGQLEEDKHFKDGELHGSYKFYYRNGQLWTEKIFENGLLREVKCVNDREGNPLEVGTFDDGNGTLFLYDYDGERYCIVTYQDGEEVEAEYLSKSED